MKKSRVVLFVLALSGLALAGVHRPKPGEGGPFPFCQPGYCDANYSPIVRAAATCVRRIEGKSDVPCPVNPTSNRPPC